MLAKVGLVCGAILVSAATLGADQGNSQGRGRSGGNSGGTSSGNAVGKAGSDVNAAVNIFTDRDRTTFRDYFRTHKIAPEALPPGIARNVARGKPLPPGIAKKALPNDLVRGLGTRAGKDVTFSIVGDRVVALRGGNVVDVLMDVFR